MLALAVAATSIAVTATPDVDARVLAVAGDPTVDEVVLATGTVQGTPTNGSGGELDCITVRVFDAADLDNPVATQTTAGDNTYSISGLTAGVSHTIQFESDDTGNCSGLASEWLGDIPMRLTNFSVFGDIADTFTVTDGGTTTIDPVLELFGTVSGTVVSERTGLGLEGIEMRLYPLDAGGVASSEWVDVESTEDGSFVVDDPNQKLPPNDYELFAIQFTSASGLVWGNEFWNDKEGSDTADLISVTSNAVTALGNVDRHGPGALTGTVTEDGTGDPLAGVVVNLYADGGATVLASDTTAANGTYDLGEVNPGDYDVEFEAPEHDDEWNNGSSTPSGSTSIASSAENDPVTTTLNATLSPANGSISGKVTADELGGPVSGATVTLYEPGGSVEVASTTTAADGTYSLMTLDGGTYDLEFVATGFVTEWYDDAPTAAAGSITLATDQALVANAGLADDLGSVSGTVTDGSALLGGPVAGITVEAHQDGNVVGSATTNAAGSFLIADIPAGTYTVLANTGPPASPDTYFSVWHGGAPLFVTEDAEPVVVTGGYVTTGVDLALQPLFVDVVAGSGFYADIVWMQESGITVGCGNDAYCPDAFVTRAQMATFLVKALDLPADATNYFSDDNGNRHEANINALRGAGITIGCNQAGTLFCPSETVTRAQMASFIVRALGYPISGTDYFTDDDGNTHEDNINTLRQNGVTLGCNPAGTLYCPGDNVRRDHMAAFLFRALG